MPVRRIFIPKKGGKRRPLGIPTIKDRVMQTIVRMALEPEWESRFEANSYGFRPGRCTMDAICALHAALRRKESSRWILDADISKCFDEIDHEALLEKLPVFTKTIRQWLKAGVVSFNKSEATGAIDNRQAGTPQGGPLSPLLMNVALNGMERLFGCENSQGNRVNAAAKKGLDKGITLVRYADDFVIVAPTRERLESYVLPKVQAFLRERGLMLSTDKTRTLHLDEGFDFLGFTFIRQGERLLTKPSKQAVLDHLQRIRTHLRRNKQTPAARVVQQLNPVIRGWANYYRHGVSKEVFIKADHFVFIMLWRWAKRRHPKKSAGWIKARYFREDWTFTEKGAVLLVHRKIRVTRFTKVSGKASPLNPDEKAYWDDRRRKRRTRVSYKELDRVLHGRQHACCGLCGVAFGEDDVIEKHHIRSTRNGGTDRWENLMLVHYWCHNAYHARRKAARA